MGFGKKLYARTGPIAFASIANNVVLSPQSGSGIKDTLYLGQFEVGNSSGANASCGWGIQLPNAEWKAGQWLANISASYSDKTANIQAAVANSLPIATTTNNDGYVIQARQKFNIVNLIIGTAQNDAGTPEYTYWNGSAWSVLATEAVPTVTSTGTVTLVFLSPSDWTQTASTDSVVTTVGLDSGMYAIRVRYTTHPSVTAGVLSGLNIVKLYDFYELVPDGNSIIFQAQGEIRIPGRASIVPYCSTADTKNWCDIEYRNGG